MAEESRAEPACDFVDSVIAVQRRSLAELVELAIRLYGHAPDPEHGAVSNALMEALAESRRLDLTEAVIRMERADAVSVATRAAGVPHRALRAVAG